MIKSIIDRLPQLEQLRLKGIERGETTGFTSLDELYSVKQGTYTLVYSEPTHGKSEFTFELCFNQIPHGKRSLICSPETGTVDEIIAELLHKYTGKKIYKSEIYGLTEREFYDAINWLNHNFVIVDTDDKTFSIPELFEIADQWEKEHPGEKIHIIVGEPYNELDHSEMSTKFGSRQDLYIEDLISVVRRLCRKRNRHFILTIHPSGAATPITKHGVTYYPKPLPRQAAGGQALYRKAMTWITLWRPPRNFKDDMGQPCKDNEVHVFIDKAKPKGVATRGMRKLFFDWHKNRYYEEAWGNPYYAYEQKPSETLFTEIKKIDVLPDIPTVPIVTPDELLPF